MQDTALTAKTVRVSIPASVASDLGSLKKTYASILDKLGCRACCSGYDIFLERQREGLFREGPRAGLSSAFSRGQEAGRTISVAGSPAALGDIVAVNDMLDRIADFTGHMACISGYDFDFRNEILFAVNPQLDIQEIAVRVGP